ncbi:DEAD-box ATP-dependent RNA helicase 38 [Tanacetum coccineum]
MESTLFDSTMKLVKVNVPDDQAMIDVTANKIVEYAVTNKQAVLFVPSIEVADKLYVAIKELEYFDTAIAHDGLEQKHRETLLDLYYKGFFQILITTDVKYLYEGINPFKVNLVVNFDLPVKSDSPDEPDMEVYWDRSCSRGAVFNLLCGDRAKMIMEKIEKQLNLTVIEVPSWESFKDFDVAFVEAGLYPKLLGLEVL